jgi:hypothetical protein
MDLGRLLLDPPGRLVFHERGRGEFPRYEARDGGDWVTHRVGEERHWTRCGRLTYETRSESEAWNAKSEIIRRFDGIRRDNAELVGRPCRSCARCA